MVEEMYQQERKEVECAEERERNQSNSGQQQAQTPTTPPSAATSTAPPPPTTTTTKPTGKRSDINATESDPSLHAINRSQSFSENQANHSATTTAINNATTASEVAPPVSQCFDSVSDDDLPPHRSIMDADDTCRHGSLAADYGTAPASGGGGDIGSTLIRFGTTAGDVSLTLGLRHAGNMPEKTNSFSVRDFGGI